MTRLVFVRSGSNKRMIKEMPDADARQAEKEGWGQLVNDPKTDGRSYSLSDEPDHAEKADAYFHRQQQGYANRELTSAPSPTLRSSSSGELGGGVDAQQRQTGEPAPPSGRAKKQPVKKKTK